MVRVICKAARGDGRTGGRGVREAVAGPCPPPPTSPSGAAEAFLLARRQCEAPGSSVGRETGELTGAPLSWGAGEP